MPRSRCAGITGTGIAIGTTGIGAGIPTAIGITITGGIIGEPWSHFRRVEI